MSNLILTDGVNTNTWFKNFFEEKKYKKVGLRLSAGTDSALILFFLAKFITETKNYDISIYPWTGLETNDIHSNVKNLVDQIISLIKLKYPKVDIKKPHISVWTRTPPYQNSAFKDMFSRPIVREYEKESNLDIYLAGTTSNAPEHILRIYKVYNHRPKFRDLNSISETHEIEKYPWMYNDKKFIASQYKKYNLMEDLFPITESCTGGYGLPFPCKKCFNCMEKYWAFGMFDKCETK